ncbi:MAG: DUF815 domain-containing protein [Ruminococcus sp.]|nr:DUF815 domain-containing protein [Ruminococcus sp.]
MNDKLIKLCRSRDLVAIFRGLAQDEVFHRLMILIGSDNRRLSSFLADYSDFVSELYKKDTVDLSSYLLKLVLEDDNVYIRQVAAGMKPSDEMQECLSHELDFLQEVAQLKPEDFSGSIDYSGFLPRWTTSPTDLIESYTQRLDEIEKYGYGKWAKYTMFRFRDGDIIPEEYPDSQHLSDLFGYKEQRSEIINNTKTLLEGKPARNVLLYGDSGTGKTSTVKAVANEFAPQGLRLIEITKEQLGDIPAIFREISHNLLKFIIFIDDLSSDSGNDSFGALEATLERTAAARPDNAVIYATSNRSDRDDADQSDTIREALSLSSRFGLRMNFDRPEIDEYITIVTKLAKSSGLIMNKKELAAGAERFAITSGNGRSPRTAKQYINYMLASLR